MDKLAFGKLIKARRKELKLTAEELAKKVSIDRTYLSKIERHGLLPSDIIFLDLMTSLNIDDKKAASNYIPVYTQLKFPTMSKSQVVRYYTGDLESRISHVKKMRDKIGKRSKHYEITPDHEKVYEKMLKRVDGLISEAESLIAEGKRLQNKSAQPNKHLYKAISASATMSNT